MMDARRYLVAALSTLALAGTANAGVNAAIIKLNERGPHYVYSAQKIHAGDTIRFQFPQDDQPACCRQSSGKAATLLASDPDAVDFSSERKLYRYRLVDTGISTSWPFLGIAVIGDNVSVEQDGPLQVKTHRGATTSNVLLCTSQEGVHLVSRAAGKVESHLYLYLGYDIESPTCTSAQLE
jgi:hypothetical protein